MGRYAKKPMSPAEYKAKLEKNSQRQEFYNPLENPSNFKTLFGCGRLFKIYN